MGLEMAPRSKRTLGSLLVDLRSNRMLTQDRLAGLAGVAKDVISRVERGGTAKFRASTTIRIFKALAAEQSLTQSEAETFLELAGLDSPRLLLPPYTTPDPIAMTPDQHYAALARAAGGSEYLRLHAAAGRLAAQVGYHRAIAIIDALRGALASGEPQPAKEVA